MSYSKQELDKLVQAVLQIAKDNLLKDGFVQPVGLLYGITGLQSIFSMKFSGVEEKRAVQAQFKAAILETEALAAVVVTESWFRTPTPGEPVDLTRSVRENIQIAWRPLLWRQLLRKHDISSFRFSLNRLQVAMNSQSLSS